MVQCLFAVVAVAGAGCSGDAARGPDTAQAKSFTAYPLYWLGPRFEKWDLEHLQVRAHGFSFFVYGNCKPKGGEQPSCAPPLDVQVQPLCSHLAAVARAPVWKRRQIRGAPVGTIDSAPVLFTRAVQVKVYVGDGGDRGAAMRALRALRSINRVPPVISTREPIPPPRPGVLEGTRACEG